MAGKLEAYVRRWKKERTGAQELAALLVEARTATAILQSQFAASLREEVNLGASVIFAADWLLSLLAVAPSGRGRSRAEPARWAASCLRNALGQGGERRAASDRERGLTVDRAALEAEAVAAFDGPLRGLVEQGGLAAEGARRALVGVAADAGEWQEVDRLVAAAGKGAALAAAVETLLDVARSHDIAGRKEKVAPDVSALVQPILARVDALRPKLRKSDLVDVEAELERLGKRFDVTTSITPSTRDLVERLLVAPPKQRHPRHLELIGIIRDRPAEAECLPALESLEPEQREQIAGLQLLALRQLRDVSGVGEHLRRRRGLGVSITPALSTIGNGGQGMSVFAEVIAPYLEDEDADVRWWTAYYLLAVAEKDAPELAAFARPMLRSIIDGVRPPGSTETITSRSRPALAAALKATKRRDEFVAAARAVDAELAPAERTKFRAQLKPLFPEGHAAVTGTASVANAAAAADLLAAVYAAPDDDAPRLVYADKLLETGDVRGEFIVLQCERHRTGGPVTARETELLAKHRKKWLGNVASWIEAEPRFERGFLFACSLLRRLESIPGPVSLNGAWRTVEELDTSRAYRDLYKSRAGFVGMKALAQLRVLNGIDIADLIAFKGRRLVRLGVLDDDLYEGTLVDCVARQTMLEDLTFSTEPSETILAGLGTKARSLQRIATPTRRLVRRGDRWRS